MLAHKRKPLLASRTAFALGLVLCVAAGLGALLLVSGLPSGRIVIRMSDTGFSPSRLTIKKGQVVTFVNEGEHDHWPASNIHPTHEVDAEFDPRKPIPPGQSWSFAFQKSGVWRFHDHLYPESGGVIIAE